MVASADWTCPIQEFFRTSWIRSRKPKWIILSCSLIQCKKKTEGGERRESICNSTYFTPFHSKTPVSYISSNRSLIPCMGIVSGIKVRLRLSGIYHAIKDYSCLLNLFPVSEFQTTLTMAHSYHHTLLLSTLPWITIIWLLKIMGAKSSYIILLIFGGIGALIYQCHIYPVYATPFRSLPTPKASFSSRISSKRNKRQRGDWYIGTCSRPEAFGWVITPNPLN